MELNDRSAGSPDHPTEVVKAGIKGPFIDRAFAAVAAVVVSTVAIVSEPGGAAETIALIVAAVAYAAPKFVPAIPDEVAAAVVIVAVGLSLAPGGRLEVGVFLVVIVVLDSAAEATSVARASLVLAGAIAMLVITWSSGASLAPVPWLAACGFTFVLGLTLRRQRRLIRELEEARRALAEAAVAEERRRVARELHDLAGHTLAAALLHVTGARHVLRRDLDEAEAALVEAEAVGRSGLDKVRAAVSALRTTERGTDAPLATPADLPGLVAEYRRVGLSIDDSIAPEVAALDGPVGTAVHRIAREALTNVARHAPDNRVELRVTVESEEEPDRVSLLVADHGRPAPTARPGGFGLVGMEERARGLCGAVRAGPSADGWRVEAQIPLGSTAQAGVAP